MVFTYIGVAVLSVQYFLICMTNSKQFLYLYEIIGAALQMEFELCKIRLGL